MIAPQNEVEQYFAELMMARIKLKAHKAVQNYDWSQVEALIKQMENLNLGEWSRDEVGELKKLLKQRDQEIFSKEALLSSTSNRHKYRTGLADFEDIGEAELRQSIESQKLSFLQRKARFGKKGS